MLLLARYRLLKRWSLFIRGTRTKERRRLMKLVLGVGRPLGASPFPTRKRRRCLHPMCSVRQRMEICMRSLLGPVMGSDLMPFGFLRPLLLTLEVPLQNGHL